MPPARQHRHHAQQRRAITLSGANQSNRLSASAAPDTQSDRLGLPVGQYFRRGRRYLNFTSRSHGSQHRQWQASLTSAAPTSPQRGQQRHPQQWHSDPAAHRQRYNDPDLRRRRDPEPAPCIIVSLTATAQGSTARSSWPVPTMSSHQPTCSRDRSSPCSLREI